jgi:hypothetical protein
MKVCEIFSFHTKFKGNLLKVPFRGEYFTWYLVSSNQNDLRAI